MSLPFVEEGETSENLTQSIHTPVIKPREAQSVRELPAAIRRRTELLAVILLYNYIRLCNIIQRAPGVANGNNHFLLLAAVHPGLHCTELAG